MRLTGTWSATRAHAQVLFGANGAEGGFRTYSLSRCARPLPTELHWKAREDDDAADSDEESADSRTLLATPTFYA